ncbi:hypothetical protein KHQ82_09000 [Mycoplasmatota bacterium]|nr:hypothetical protein KHQ82_09000 [Mycoplasmatota bacterium]
MRLIIYILSLLLIMVSLLGCIEKNNSLNQVITNGDFTFSINLNDNVLNEDDNLVLSTSLKYSGSKKEEKVKHSKDYIYLHVIEDGVVKPFMIPDLLMNSTVLRTNEDDINFYELPLEWFEWNKKKEVILLITADFFESDSNRLIMDIEVPLIIK